MSTNSLQSKDHADLLDVIDVLRSQGISHYVKLPQLIVCGDQSSGKSSVLEAVAGIPFPRRDNLCTRFATEVVLRRDGVTNVSIAITPAADRSDSERAKLANFKAPAVSTDELPAIIDAAAEAMGIDTASRSFSQDILRIEICGPQQPHLTLVDLPGVVHADAKQPTATIPGMVTGLVREYMANPRSVILAVVSAKNDYANQIVTTYAQEADPEGCRTLGIITKPDELIPGSDSEKEYLELAANKDFKFRLGWHVLRNRDFHHRDDSLAQRNEREQEFFSKGYWTSFPANVLGVDSLRPRLSKILKDQIISELPSLEKDVELGIDESRHVLERLGDSRASTEEQRLYLIRVSQTFTFLVQAAVDGIYSDDFFGKASTCLEFSRRLRAVVQDLLVKFTETMRTKGHAREIVNAGAISKERRHPPQIRRKDFAMEIKELVRTNRGREVSGTFNPLIIGTLFFQQARPWKELLNDYGDQILQAVQSFLKAVMAHAADEETNATLWQEFIDPALLSYTEHLQAKIAELLRPYESGHAITYNHYFTDTIQKARQKHIENTFAKRLNGFFDYNRDSETNSVIQRRFNIESLHTIANQSINVEMEGFGSSEAIDCMNAYYHVALKVIVDNFAALAIEPCIMRALPETFSPEKVLRLDDETVRRIASETETSKNERKRASTKLKSLEAGLRTLNRLSRHALKEAYNETITEPFEEIDPRSPESVESELSHQYMQGDPLESTLPLVEEAPPVFEEFQPTFENLIAKSEKAPANTETTPDTTVKALTIDTSVGTPSKKTKKGKKSGGSGGVL